MTTAPYEVRLTHSIEFGVAEIIVRDGTLEGIEAKVQEARLRLADQVAQAQANLAGLVSLAHNSVERTVPVVEQPPAQHPSQQQSAQPPAWAQQQPSNVVPIQQPQGGRVCQECGQPLIAKTTSSNKNVWRCDAWRWNNGNPNNHTSLKPGEGF